MCTGRGTSNTCGERPFFGTEASRHPDVADLGELCQRARYNQLGGHRPTSASLMSRTEARNPSRILLFNGTGTSRNDVVAIEAILDDHLQYSTANSAAVKWDGGIAIS